MAEATATRTILDVPNVSCGHCERAITSALVGLDGIEQVAVDIPGKRVLLSYDPSRVETEAITALLAEEGYPVAAVSSQDASEAIDGPPGVGGCSCCNSAS